MEDEHIAFLIGMVAGAILAAILMLIPLVRIDNHYKAECIKRDYAEYSTKTGKWQWKEKNKIPVGE